MNVSTGMTVHLYSQCWNEAEMLPFFFRHYDPIVDHYFIFDDGSTDESLEILSGHPRVTVACKPRTMPGSLAVSQQFLFNHCWKASRGRADWVIVTDIDEHLYHEELSNYLLRCVSAGVTLVPALGFQMISEEPPSGEADLCLNYTMGAPFDEMLKASIFDPNAVTEIAYKPGRHRAAPTGRILLPPVDEVFLLHYKYMGFQRTYSRQRALAGRLGFFDRYKAYGRQYWWDAKQFRSDWDAVRQQAVDIHEFRRQPSQSYPLTPWFAGFTRVTSRPQRGSDEREDEQNGLF